MSISHHPSEETLLRYAAGTLPSAPARVVATHLHGCAACRLRAAQFDAAGGALLEETDGVPLSPGAFAQAMASLDGRHPPPPARMRRMPPALLPGGIALPEPLRDCEVGPWRWLGPGIRVSRLTIPDDPKAKLNLLRVAAGMKLPDHGHSGTEFTHVISGAFSDSFGRYLPGDTSEVDADMEHQPVVDPDGECICLVAMDGEMRLRGVLGRLIQPFVRF